MDEEKKRMNGSDKWNGKVRGEAGMEGDRNEGPSEGGRKDRRKDGKKEGEGRVRKSKPAT